MSSHRLRLPLAVGFCLSVACNRPPHAGSPAVAHPKETAGLADSARIDAATARRTALARVPNGSIAKEELEREQGRLVYSFDITRGSEPGVEEVRIDATDGSVVAVEHETPSQETTEAHQDTAGHP